jgi:predicted transcriptional regulator
MRPLQKPKFLLQVRIDEETQERMQRLQRQLECSGPQLVERSIRELEISLEAVSRLADQNQ